jgi:hypothetical protein
VTETVKRRRRTKTAETVIADKTSAVATGLTRPEQVEAAVGIVFDSLPEIVEILVEKAKAGSVQHAKYIFELARVAEVAVVREEVPEPWVTELLSALRALPEPSQPTPAV